MQSVELNLGRARCAQGLRVRRKDDCSGSYRMDTSAATAHPPETQFVVMPCRYFCPRTACRRFQFPCSACHFCPEGTGVILPRCPEGTESDPNADDIDDCIADRITFWRIQPLKTTHR